MCALETDQSPFVCANKRVARLLLLLHSKLFRWCSWNVRLYVHEAGFHLLARKHKQQVLIFQCRTSELWKGRNSPGYLGYLQQEEEVGSLC